MKQQGGVIGVVIGVLATGAIAGAFGTIAILSFFIPAC